MENSIEYLLNPELETINPEFKGNISIDGKFYNTREIEKAPVLDVLKWKLSKNPQQKEKKQDDFQVSMSKKLNKKALHDDCIIWLGHASFYIRLNGISFVTDPCFYNIGHIKRKFEIPYQIKELPAIDYILVSHAHRDHFDKKSVEEIIKYNPSVIMLLPLGTSGILKNSLEVSKTKTQEAAWFQQFNINQNIKITFLPSKHWNRRGLFDYNKSLWGSFMLEASNKSIYFAGDTGFSKHFSEIAKLFSQTDICILPVGAYKPAFLMQREHLSPKEAMKAFNILNGKLFIPMHYGTYDLSNEPMGEPYNLLKAMKDKDLAPIHLLQAGEKFNF
jgi:L-ascorbate metabolism protein UlaG (beta-lactamase superfamily)